MKKILTFLLVLFIGFVHPLPDNGLSVVTVEGDVITGNNLPRYGVLCEDAEVQNAPYEGFEVIYTLPKGTTVRLREQSQGGTRSWVMIKPAEYIRLTALCGG